MAPPERTAGHAPPDDPQQDLVGDRDRLISIGVAAVFGACVVFGALRFAVHVVTGRATPWWGNTGGAVAIALLFLWYRGDRARRSAAVVHGTALIASVALMIPTAYGMSSSKWWLALVGFSVLLMGRRYERIVWSAITAVLLPLTALLEGTVVVHNAVGEPPAERAMAGLFFVVLLLGVTASFRRVAQRRARELTETAASLARANLVKSRFLAHMSHEIRTPLHGVIAMTDMALEGEAAPPVRAQIQTAQQSARVLLGLLNNVLDVARAEADALELEARPFALHAALTEALTPFATQARSGGLTFEARAAPGIAERRVGDRVRFTQVVLNLVSNALKFTRAGGISVQLRAAPDDDAVLEVVVADTGVGIPAAKLDAIFEPFAQAAVADARLQNGAGLGLAIVREITRRMDGGVRVESAPGRGSTFVARVRLPRDETAPNPAGPEALLAAPAVPPARPGPHAQPRALRVLICEDDPINQKVLLAMLKRLGHACLVVHDGLEAARVLEHERFDVLVTDIEMPGLDGVELTRRIRARESADGGPRLPIIGATAHVGEAEQHRLLDVGIDAHLPKPFTLADLSVLIARVSSG